MLRMCVLTVFTDTDSSAAISGRGQVRRKIPQYPELARADLPGLRRYRQVFGHQGCAAYDVEDVGEQRGVSRLMPRQRLQQLP